ncbi:hypothetical protein [Luteimonas sp. MC1895]|uniref:hypothetical protein n=1 Tax=Luteimonas sp. MC1895 TaxID=2819513 RepID=UPI0018F0DD5D|nr:hypothetical protein [Luteimonas sp. MC1895]MBJ6980051.1 hypothetical protein [Luteimonas sp. MC1895]
MDDGSPTDARSQAWEHDLRNAVNGALLSVVVARRLLAQGDVERAEALLADTQAACERGRELLSEPPSPSRDD